MQTWRSTPPTTRSWPSSTRPCVRSWPSGRRSRRSGSEPGRCWREPRARGALAARERRAAGGMQPPLLEAVEAERLQQPLRSPEHLLGDQSADTDHLVAVVGVGDDVGVLPEHVEDREAVRREAADATRRLLGEQVPLALEALEAVLEPRRPQPGELLPDD